LIIPPHNGAVYGASDPMFRNGGWSYEVTTDTEIYRISTVSDDFIGTAGTPWTPDLEAAYQKYKDLETPWEAAKAVSTQATERTPRDSLDLYDALLNECNAAVAYFQARRDLLLQWPNAYEDQASFAKDTTMTHWEHVRSDIEKTERVRQRAEKLCRE